MKSLLFTFLFHFRLSGTQMQENWHKKTTVYPNLSSSRSGDCSQNGGSYIQMHPLYALYHRKLINQNASMTCQFRSLFYWILQNYELKWDTMWLGLCGRRRLRRLCISGIYARVSLGLGLAWSYNYLIRKTYPMIPGDAFECTISPLAWLFKNFIITWSNYIYWLKKEIIPTFRVFLCILDNKELCILISMQKH